MQIDIAEARGQRTDVVEAALRFGGQFPHVEKHVSLNANFGQ
jgi:hypothetical protein